jgi:hypothetical protein
VAVGRPGPDRTRAHCIDPNVVFCKVHRQAARELRNCAFRGVVRNEVRLGYERRNRCDESGEIDVDGNDTILLSGVDELAVAKLKFTVELTTDSMVDLTPPNTVDDTQTDPDSSGLSPRTFINISWDEFTTSTAQWTVEFMGDSNGDYFLEKGERAEITLWLHEYDGTNVLYDLGAGTSDGYVDSAIELLQQRDSFAIEIIVSGASSLVLERTLPLELATSDLLD